MQTAHTHIEELKSNRVVRSKRIGNSYQLKYESLNLRERQIASLIGEGEQADVIAKKLHLPVDLVQDLKCGLMVKLQLKTTKEYDDFLLWVTSYLN